jgi:hypothetical protein
MAAVVSKKIAWSRPSVAKEDEESEFFPGKNDRKYVYGNNIPRSLASNDKQVHAVFPGHCGFLRDFRLGPNR